MDLLKLAPRLGFVLTLSLATGAFAQSANWAAFQRETEAQIERDRVLGWSYIVSGGLSLAGGLVGSTLAKDPAESVVFTLFQNIGVASIGFGYLRLEAGDERRSFYYTLRNVPNLSERDRDALVRAYSARSAEIARRTRTMQALTTGLLAAINLYGGLREKNTRGKTWRLLIGGVNLLACASFSFEF